jgi:hypothetical protein
VSLNALKPDISEEDDLAASDFVSGADCNCPEGCDEVVYSQELSVADLRDEAPIDGINDGMLSIISVKRSIRPLWRYKGHIFVA